MNFKFRKNGDSTGTLYDVYTAAGGNLVKNTLYTFTKSGISGNIITGNLTDTEFKLKKTDAFFIYSNIDGLILRIYKAQQVLSPKTLASAALKYPQLQRFISAPLKGRSPKMTLDESKYWRVNIGIQTNDKQFNDAGNYFGIDYIGEDGIDICDVIKLMPPDPYAALYFNKAAEGEANVLSSDIRTPVSVYKGAEVKQIKWNLDVVSRGVDYQDGYLYWDVKTMPSNGNFTLFDKTLNVETDMRKFSRYKVAIDGSKHSFEIIYTPEMK